MAIEVVADPATVNPEDVIDPYLDEEFWNDRTVERAAQAPAGTDIFLKLRDPERDESATSARVITDFAYYAHVHDVVVTEDRRGEGLGDGYWRK